MATSLDLGARQIGGLALAAQEAAIRAFATAQGFDVLEVVSEVTSGKLGIEERTGLRSALAKAKNSAARSSSPSWTVFPVISFHFRPHGPCRRIRR